MTSTTKANLELQPVTASDLPEVATVFPRSFHPISSFMRQAMPDTPVVRKWWIDVHQGALSDPDVHLMKVIDKDNDGAIIAICRWRTDRQGNCVDAGTWSQFQLSEDHDHELCNAFIVFMAEQRPLLMAGRPHIFIELLLTVHEHKGKGAGKMLIQQLCKDADEAELECFVETNKDVVTFYEQLGFKLEKKAEMPGGHGYEEFILIKPANSRARPTA